MAEGLREQLYQLIPAIYRTRDAAEGEPLRALIGIIEEEFNTLEADMDRLYENWFIETCDDWVVPYLGDLLGVRGLPAPSATSQRARVANTIRHRRAKGTAALLERLAQDVTGWPARAVEFYRHVSVTQHLERLRLNEARTANLRDTDALPLMGTAFEGSAYTAELRAVAPGGGRYNLANLGLFLWRLQSYPIQRGTARPVTIEKTGGEVGKGYTFHPMGLDTPLFNQPGRASPVESEGSEVGREGRTGAVDVPGRLRRLPLYRELESLREKGGLSPRDAYFGASPVLAVHVGDPGETVAESHLFICDLTAWELPPMPGCRPQGGSEELPIGAAVDPERGRLMLSTGGHEATVEISYSYGFSGNLGGGPYDRDEAVRASLAAEVDWRAAIGAGPVTSGVHKYPSLAEAFAAFQSLPDRATGILTIQDSRTHLADLTLNLGKGRRLAILAADGARPYLMGGFQVTGEAGRLALDGLLVGGAVTAGAGVLQALEISDCTVLPLAGGSGPAAAVQVNGSGLAAAPLSVAVRRTICGPVRVTGMAHLTGVDSVIGWGTDGLDAGDAEAELSAVTVLGTASFRSLEALNSIFTKPVTAALRQTGCVQFCYVPPGSRVARPYQCQPDLRISQAASEAEREQARLNIRPVFSSTTYGEPDFGRLSAASPVELRTGADDQGEMGAFHFLQQPQREANLRAALDEYLPFGLEMGFFYIDGAENTGKAGER